MALDQFKPDNAADGNPRTFWMPKQASDRSEITIDLIYDKVLCGFDIIWRRAPSAFRVEYLDTETKKWTFVNRWDSGLNNVGSPQVWEDGFPARMITIFIERAQSTVEGKIIALQDIRFYTPLRKGPTDNIAWRRPVQVSQEDIRGNLGGFANDGNDRGTYWQPGWDVRKGWIIVELDDLPVIPGEGPPGHDIGWIKVLWRYAPVNFYVELYWNREWRICYTKSGVYDLVSDITFKRKALKIRITIQTINTDIGIKEIFVYKYYGFWPEKTLPDRDPWITKMDYMTDRSKDSYWMGPPLEAGDKKYIECDLGKIYNASDIQIYFGFRPQDILIAVSEDRVTWDEKLITSGATYGMVTLLEAGNSFSLRYARLYIKRGFQDPDSGLTGWGTTVRDFAVLLFVNLARGKEVWTDSIWEYPPSWASDNDPNLQTEWVSRFGAQRAYITYDFGRPKNIAGMNFMFGHIAIRFQVAIADTNDNRTKWKIVLERSGNLAQYVELGEEVKFKARYIKLLMSEPNSKKEWHPDRYGDSEYVGSIFSVKNFNAFEHPGGGAVFGIQSLDGMQYTSVAYGLREPGLWVIASDRDLMTKDIRTNFSSDVGQQLHFAVTIRRIRKGPGFRDIEIAMYRNGMAYGDPYVMTEPAGRMDGPNKTRIVVGIRSSAHALPQNASAPEKDPRYGVTNGFTHSPYYYGHIMNLTLLKNALSAEEVRGIYNVHANGGQELGCHCYDACPTGANRFFPDVQVPCSGQGACRRKAGIAFEPGVCVCSAGYSGDACQNHCSTLSKWGCCEEDDDCPYGVVCNKETKACSE
eukprot:TRINITY_DN27603_c0_g1_i1.p1 TRINITY_DN27603_c0_g1~~TRINITY_DN27603_c0_g1_i1.p1  ORF type:complete len:931 (-),score=103.66 TRINITY_DN27603_c0_g1_i1:52-2475(-)